MMFSGTISTDIRNICVKYMENPVEIIVEDQSQLVLNGLDQYMKELTENQKISELAKILDNLDYSQVIIFVKTHARAQALSKELEKR
jgi:ATP-dependent RNA helicase UAP56/SUB2